jgi:hypothetical protein
MKTYYIEAFLWTATNGKRQRFGLKIQAKNVATALNEYTVHFTRILGSDIFVYYTEIGVFELDKAK